MTDPDLVRKKLAQIETYVAEIRRLGKPELLETDLRERRFLEHTLQLTIQACLDVASHVVSDQRLGEPGSNRQLFESLASTGWIPVKQAETLARMAGFRNILVHSYGEVDLDIVRTVLRDHLDDFLAYAAAVRSRLG